MVDVSRANPCFLLTSSGDSGKTVYIFPKFSSLQNIIHHQEVLPMKKVLTLLVMLAFFAGIPAYS